MNTERKSQISQLSRNEIYAKLLTWFDKGLLIPRDDVPMLELERRINLRELSYTPITKVLFVGDSRDNEDYFEFRTLADTGRILSSLGVKVKKDIRTFYALQKAEKNGDVMRFDYKSVLIYID